MKISIAPILAALVVTAAVGTWAWAQDDLPDGPGKQELMDACSTCHDTGLITAQKRSSADWSDVMDQMVGMGASLNDAQYATVLAYLNKNYGTGAPAAAASPAPAATPAPATPVPAAPAPAAPAPAAQ